MSAANRRLLEEWGTLVSRALLALVFVASGFFKLAHPDETATIVAAQGIPASMALVLAVGCFELAAGMLLLVGYHARACALVLIGFLVPVTALFHNPAGLGAPETELQATMIMKNLAIAGGLLAIVAHGAGPLSLDRARLGTRD